MLTIQPNPKPMRQTVVNSQKDCIPFTSLVCRSIRARVSAARVVRIWVKTWSQYRITADNPATKKIAVNATVSEWNQRLTKSLKLVRGDMNAMEDMTIQLMAKVAVNKLWSRASLQKLLGWDVATFASSVALALGLAGWAWSDSLAAFSDWGGWDDSRLTDPKNRDRPRPTVDSCRNFTSLGMVSPIIW